MASRACYTDLVGVQDQPLNLINSPWLAACTRWPGEFYFEVKMRQKLQVSKDEICQMTHLTRSEIARRLGVSAQRIAQIVGRKRYFHCHISKIRHLRSVYFWERVRIGNYDDCWPWKKGCAGFGYGSLKVNGKKEYAHHFAYEFFKGPIIEGLFVLHKCNNPVCCNPNHLYLGTQKQNVSDREDRYKNGELVQKYHRHSHIVSSHGK